MPGMSVMFAFLSTTLIASLFYREHYWGTWDRLRASSASRLDLLLGKVAPLYICLLGQMVVLFALGIALFGYRPNGSYLAMALLLVAMVAAIVAFGVLLVVVFTSLDQAMIVGSLGGMVMSGLSGALAPASSLPGWAQWLALGTPTYWGLRGLHEVSLEHAGLTQVLGPLALLVAFAAAFAVLAVLSFRPADRKIGNT